MSKPQYDEDEPEYPDESDSEKESNVDEEEDDDDVVEGPRVPKKPIVRGDDDEDYEEEEEEDDDDDDIENEEELLNNMNSTTETGEKAAFIGLDNFSDDDEDDEDDDPHYLQKFNESIQRNIIADFHPELQSHNYEEIETLSRVVRDAEGNIIDPMHKTLPFLSRYEKARILGERAKQIDNGAKPFVEVDETMIDGYLIAYKEFEAKKIPFIIKRPLPNGVVEYWRLSDLVVLE
jgi:DNA-directed RNA polymerase I, II, and III subunit RPABC2